MSVLAVDNAANIAAPSGLAGACAPAAVAASRLTKTFGNRTALDEVSFMLPEGSFLSIFGPNGAGKTTLLRVLCTLVRPTLGTASVLGHDILKDPEDVREHIGLISHKPMLYPDLTVEENLRLAGKLYGVVHIDVRLSEMLEALELKNRRLNKARTLSRGMTQRLAIACAFMHDPSLVFLDEPYSGLDPHAVEILDGLISSPREGRTLCMVSHDLQKGFSLCTHALILAKGRVVFFGEKNDIDFAEFAQVYAATVGAGAA